MKSILTGITLIAFLLIPNLISAHEVRPAYLRIVQVDVSTFETLWRVPARGEMRLGIYLEMPPDCMAEAEPLTWIDGAAFVEQQTYTCAGGLFGSEVLIGGLDTVMTDALARVERLDGTTQIARLSPSDASFVVSAAESRADVAFTYSYLGVEHILKGIDHLLFVLALLFLVPGARALFWTITAFTLAHSVTLAAATLGWVQVPQQPVEAVIALSILFVAVEIVHTRQGRPGIGRQWPWLVAFIFGLLHGFGFAGALSEIGLPEHAIPLSLLFFNLGVEAGQLLFIGAVLLMGSVVSIFNWPQWAWKLPVYGIGSMAAFWTIERLAGIAAY